MEIGLLIAGFLAVAGIVQWSIQDKKRKNQQYTLDYALKSAEIESRQREEELRLEREEAEKQKNRLFGMDFMITHGSAFGGCAAVCQDGRHRKGTVPLDQIMMYGKQPSGREFTYYIEDQGLEICATDEKDSLLVRSNQMPFEIREAGLSRDQGISTKKAEIKKDILYYIILESKHEISIKATKQC
jgi:hypothetical protein